MQPATSPSFDTWTSLFLAASAMGFFIALLILTSQNSWKKNFPIALIMIGFSLILIQYVFYWTGYKKEYPYVYFCDIGWYYAFGPLLYYYLVKLHNSQIKFNYFHFAPAIIVSVLLFYYSFNTQGFQVYDNYINDPIFKLTIGLRAPWAAAVSFVIYNLLIGDFLKLNQSKNEIELGKVRASWTKFLRAFFWLFSIAYMSYYVLVSFSFFNANWDYAISVSMAIGIYGIGYFVFKQPAIFDGALFSTLFIQKENAIISDKTKMEFYDRIAHFMQAEKPYLNPDLRLVNLADQTEMSTHVLSEIINEQSGMNFNQYINSYRIKEAEHLLLTRDDLAIKTIFFDVGFNNKVSFYTAFKNKHNCTPSEFRKKNRI